MSTQTVNGVIIIDDDGDDDAAVESNYFFSHSLSSRGSTKYDAISVENYEFDSHQYSHLWIKSEYRSNYNDLNQSNHSENNDDAVKIHPSQSSEPSSSRSFSFQCEICVDYKPLTESFRINGCTHSYCKECVSKYIATKLQDNLLTITCPVSGCSGNLEPDQCRQILPREVFDRWGDALCEALVERSKRFYCPYKECSALVFVEEAMIEAECPHCNRMVCVPCGTKWHSGVSCEEYQKLDENERGGDDILLKKLAEKFHWVRCPHCRSYVERTLGCLYMLCRCGLAFCYNCGAPSKDNSHYCHSCKH